MRIISYLQPRNCRPADIIIPTTPIADSSGNRGGWYRALGWRAAARKTKNNTRIPKETGYITPCGLSGRHTFGTTPAALSLPRIREISGHDFGSKPGYPMLKQLTLRK
jgi:hypothetical protein